jgi:potassium efflux system protein
VAPLGSSPGQLLERSGRVTGSLKVGEFEIVPSAIATAVAVLVLGVVGLRLFKRWLENSFLPHTQLEPGMRSSLTTLMGYVGLFVVIAFALSALGVGVNRIAWVASALSVGIGFGLQAIVQNFISGLILLAERPVKVGDWVVLDTAEGDVRRINVRATEIELWDRSTLIVPNSEFITKTVRNMTLANPDGRVLIRLPMPLTTDARAARDLMMSACVAHESVLDDPAPLVRLDAVENGLLVFVVIGYVASPRMVAEVRSDLLFSILDRLQAAHLPLAVFVAQPGTAAALQPVAQAAQAMATAPSPTPPLTAAASPAPAAPTIPAGQRTPGSG